MKFSHKIQSIGCSPIRKFAPHAKAAEEAGKTVYYLNIGQPDIETPAEYFDAIQSFPSPVLEYAPSQGESSLINALRNYYEAMGVLLCPEDITVTTGGSEALQLVLSCILDEGDEVIVPEPFYPNYTAFTAMAGGRIVPFPTRAEEGFRVHDVSALSALITERTKALLLSNPGNPTGAVLTREEMGALANLAKQKGLFLIADEVYREFVFNGQDPVSFLELPGLDQELVVIDSVSKRYSACGARIGALVTRNRELQEHLSKLTQSRLSCPSLDQAGAAALCQLPASYLAEARERYQRRRDAVYKKLKDAPGVLCREPAGAFYAFVTLTEVEDSEDFLMFLLTRFDLEGETLMFAPGEGFHGTPGRGKNTLRLAYVLDEDKMSRAMDVFLAGLQAYTASR